MCVVWYATFLSCAFGQGSVSALQNAILPLGVLPQDVEDRTSFSSTFFSSDKVLVLCGLVHYAFVLCIWSALSQCSIACYLSADVLAKHVEDSTSFSSTFFPSNKVLGGYCLCILVHYAFLLCICQWSSHSLPCCTL